MSSAKPVAVLPLFAQSRDKVVASLKAAGFEIWPTDSWQEGEVELLVVDVGEEKGRAFLLQPQEPVVAFVGHQDAAALEALPARVQREIEKNHEAQESLRWKKQEALLLQLLSDYAEAQDVQDILHDVTRRLAEALDIERVSMVVVDEKQEHGVVVASSDDAKLHDLRIELVRYPEIREVVRTQKMLVIDHAPTHPLLEGVQWAVQAKGIRSIVVLPLGVSGQLLGVLLVRASASRGVMSPREIDFLKTASHATAVALRHANKLQHWRGLSEALKRYEIYFSQLSDGVAILDAQRRVLSMNPAGLELLDLTPSAILGKRVTSFTDEGDDTRLLELLNAASHGERRPQVDVKVHTPLGRHLTLSVTAGALELEGASVILSFRDVTLSRRMAEELRHTKEFLERLIDSSVDGIIAADMKGHIILFNKGAELITGYTAAEAMSSLHTTELYPEEGARTIMRRLRSEEMGGPGRLTSVRQEVLNKQGERIPVNMTATILYEGTQEVATVGIFTDLRAQMQLEQKLSDAQIRLEASEKKAVIVALAGAAAHELNQPLTSVLGYSELLKRRLRPEDETFRYAETLYREASRMADIVRKIGRITRFETKTYVGESQILDLEKASSHEK